MPRPQNTPEVMAFAKRLGRTIKAARRVRQVKLIGLAMDINMSHQCLSKIESGSTLPAYRTLMAVSKVLNIPMWMFIKHAENQEHQTAVFSESAAKIEQEMHDGSE